MAAMFGKRLLSINNLIIRFTHPAVMTRYGRGAVRVQA
jgi:hypothetical protein